MSCVEITFGTPKWADAVFNSPPARNVNGRARGTQLFAPKFNGKPTYAEGGNENVATYILEYLQLAGVVSRWKCQPFEWQPVANGRRKVPDFLVELADKQLVIIQVKAERFRTPDVQEVFDSESAIAQNSGIFHLVWTDKAPLDQKARNLFFKIRMARAVQFEAKELSDTVEFVQKLGKTTVADLVAAGHGPHLVPVAVRRAELFVDLRERLDERSVVSATPITDGRGYLLQSGFDAQSWWNGLPDCPNTLD